MADLKVNKCLIYCPVLITDSGPADMSLSSRQVIFFFISSCSADTCVVQKKLLLVVNRYELLDVSQFVVQIFTADLLLLVVRIRLERTNMQI